MNPVVRLRSRKTEGAEPTLNDTGLAAVTGPRRHPLQPDTIAQEIVIFRPATGHMELVRTLVRGAKVLTPAAPNGQRRVSALTEMLKTRAFGQEVDLEVEKEIKMTWSLPSGEGIEGVLTFAHRETKPRPAARTHRFVRRMRDHAK